MNLVEKLEINFLTISKTLYKYSVFKNNLYICKNMLFNNSYYFTF